MSNLMVINILQVKNMSYLLIFLKSLAQVITCLKALAVANKYLPGQEKLIKTTI